MTVRQLLASMTSAELTEWMAFYTLEPWGTDVEDSRFANLMATEANVHGDGTTTYTPADFMPRRGEGDDGGEQTAEEQIAIMHTFGG